MTDIHRQIMSLRGIVEDDWTPNERGCYRIGHRDARHAAAELAASQTARVQQLEAALNALLRHVDRETCTHEDTYRGGAIWTICRQCDRKWADDRGGFVPHVDAPAVAAARALTEKDPS